MKDVKNIIKGNTELEFVFDEECNAVKETIYINGYKERFIKFDFVTGCNVYNGAIQSGYVPDDTNADKLLIQELSEAPEYKDNRPLYNPEVQSNYDITIEDIVLHGNSFENLKIYKAQKPEQKKEEAPTMFKINYSERTKLHPLYQGATPEEYEAYLRAVIKTANKYAYTEILMLISKARAGKIQSVTFSNPTDKPYASVLIKVLKAYCNK